MFIKSSLLFLALTLVTQSTAVASENTVKLVFNKVDHPGPDIFSFLRGTWVSKGDDGKAPTREVWNGENSEGFERVREYRIKGALVGVEVAQFTGSPYGTGGTSDTAGEVPNPKRSRESINVGDYGVDFILLRYYDEKTTELYEVRDKSMTLTRTLPSNEVQKFEFTKELRWASRGRDVRMPKTTPSNP